ncbi:hypothetical protein EB796_010560 [Bugula neritina]|uniref:DUF7869 domain-containing protein n=1 Tax=Bugula neritina TaxID=10212 RepID=A0A7J7JXK4_BUGNE|nr:hypothetical protein EB796_010560 [Bugula neritina]
MNYIPKEEKRATAKPATDERCDGRTAQNAFPPEVTTDIVRFLKNYADKYGLPQPAAPRARPTASPIYLPCGTTKQGVHKIYMDSCIADNRTFVRLQTFKNLWHRTCADIKIMSRREDYCAKCELLRNATMKAKTDEEKDNTLAAIQQHMNLAYESRDLHNECISKAKNGEIKHLIFDFAEQLTLPTTTRQVGPMYFRIGRRMQLFRVCDTAIRIQKNYLYGEHQTIGCDSKMSHGPNSVISMLHHYLKEWSCDVPNLVLHADNCCGQNKNKSVVAYFIQLLCSECFNPSVKIKPNPKYKSGLYIKYVAICNDCGHEIELETEPKSESVPASKVAVLACKETGITCKQLIRFQGITDQTIINREKFHSLGRIPGAL